ncbi:unnamed protein product [Arabidopsis lyrata]|nr:unnamed protein product [Arabidopsis lyrata]
MLSEAGICRKNDRISALPDDLLLQILCLIPTKDAMTTMILSKRWRFVWTMLPKLDYADGYEDEKSNPEKSVWDFLDKSLQLHKAPSLESLRINLGQQCPVDVDVGKWVLNAVDRFVRELILQIRFIPTADPTSLPKSLYTCKTLVKLTLSGKIFVDVPSSACLPSLESLVLVSVVYKDEDSQVRLLSSCPVLRNLFVFRYKPDNVTRFFVKLPSLRKLTYTDLASRDSIDESDRSLVSDSPGLNYVYIFDTGGDDCTIQNMPHLDVAILLVGSYPTNKFLRSLSSVRCLDLSLNEVACCSAINFPRLIEFKLHTGFSDNWLEPFMLLLHNAPKLKALMITSMSLACDLVVSSRKWRCDCPLITTFIWFDDEHEEWIAFDDVCYHVQVTVKNPNLLLLVVSLPNPPPEAMSFDGLPLGAIEAIKATYRTGFQEVEVLSHITWKPKWGMIFSDIKKKVSRNCEVSQRSTMAITISLIGFPFTSPISGGPGGYRRWRSAFVGINEIRTISGGWVRSVVAELRDGSSHQGTVTSMEPNEGTFVLHTENTKKGKINPVHLVDVPGHSRLRPKLEEFLPQAAAIVFVVDALEFLPNCRAASEYLYDILTNANVVKNKISVLLCCNKTDKLTAHTKEFIRKQMEKEIEKLRASRSAVSTADIANDFSIGIEGEVFSFSHCYNKVTVAEASGLTGETVQIQDFIREYIKPLAQTCINRLNLRLDSYAFGL